MGGGGHQISKHAVDNDQRKEIRKKLSQPNLIGQCVATVYTRKHFLTNIGSVVNVNQSELATDLWGAVTPINESVVWCADTLKRVQLATKTERPVPVLA